MIFQDQDGEDESAQDESEIPIFPIQDEKRYVLALDKTIAQDEELIGVILLEMSKVAKADIKSKSIKVSLDQTDSEDQPVLPSGKYPVFLLVKNTTSNEISKKEIRVQILDQKPDEDSSRSDP